jgi:secreted Zn-dependent insulinase-like peptidase
MILSKTSKNEHPLNKFSCGTAKTLVGKGVNKCREELIKYHKTHYVGSAMTLAVQVKYQNK